jgi:hypothetical protein
LLAYRSQIFSTTDQNLEKMDIPFSVYHDEEVGKDVAFMKNTVMKF